MEEGFESSDLLAIKVCTSLLDKPDVTEELGS